MESLKEYALNNLSKEEMQKLRDGDFDVNIDFDFEYFRKHEQTIEKWTEGVEDLFYPDFTAWENKIIFALQMIAETV